MGSLIRLVGVAVVAVLLAAGTVLVARTAVEALPTTVGLNLRDGAKEIPTSQELVFRASRPIELERFRSSLVILPEAAGSLLPSPDRRTFTWTPAAAWDELTAYSVRLAGLRDIEGRPVIDGRWRFTTTLVPRLVALTTKSGQPVADLSELPAGTVLLLAFNSPMETSSVKVVAGGVRLELTWSADRLHAELDLGPLRVGPVEISFTPGGRDALGRPMRAWSLHASITLRLDG